MDGSAQVKCNLLVDVQEAHVHIAATPIMIEDNKLLVFISKINTNAEVKSAYIYFLCSFS